MKRPAESTLPPMSATHYRTLSGQQRLDAVTDHNSAVTLWTQFILETLTCLALGALIGLVLFQ